MGLTTAAEALNDLISQLRRKTTPPPPSASTPIPMTRSRAASGCPACGGAGFVVPDLPYTEPGFGKTIRCVVCANFLATSRLTPDEQQLTIDAMSSRPEDTQGYIVAMRFLAKQMLSDPFGFLSIAGVKGAGKSLLSVALVATFARGGREAVYYTAGEIAAKLTDFNGDNNDIPGDPAQFCERLKRVPVLAIDEIDKIKWSQWLVRTLGDVLDYRHRNAATHVTILTMNHGPAAWVADPGVYVEHIASRLSDGRFHRFWPTAVRDRLPPCLEKHFDSDADGNRHHYAPGLLFVDLPDARPGLRRK